MGKLLPDGVLCTGTSYCVLSMALKLERKINPKVCACSAGIWVGSSAEASHPSSLVVPKCHFPEGRVPFGMDLLWLSSFSAWKVLNDCCFVVA